jgi:hypothetical protein
MVMLLPDASKRHRCGTETVFADISMTYMFFLANNRAVKRNTDVSRYFVGYF